MWSQRSGFEAGPRCWRTGQRIRARVKENLKAFEIECNSLIQTFWFIFWLQGIVNFKLEVWDEDKFTDDDLVDEIEKSVEPRITSGKVKQFVTLSGSRATVKLELELYCAKNYYGPSCSVECIPRDDSSGHYTCDNQGRKICRRHWYGSSCTRWCIPRNDLFNGHFNCDKQGNMICLPRYEGPYCKRCVQNWFGARCSTYCVPQDNHEQGHYK